MTKKEFLSILLNIVKAYPISKCGGLNSFVLMDDIDDLIGETFGKKRKEFEAGEWWSRGWVDKGKPDACFLEFPLLAINQEESEIKDLCKGERCDTYYIWIVDKIDCKDCKCSRTYQQQYCDLQDTLINFMNELMSYGHYVDDEGNTIWANPTVAECYGLEEVCADKIHSVIKTQNVKIGPWNQNSKDGMIALIGQIEVCYCGGKEEHPQFEYKRSDDPKELCYTICEQC